MGSIFFIDSKVLGYERLIAELPEGARYCILNGDQDGLVQILNYLSGYQDIDSIHIVSHGASGKLYLGNTVLDIQYIQENPNTLQTIGLHLSDSGDILLYGCNVAEGVDGQLFIEALSNATDADVAASVDSSGPFSLNADSQLEFHVGSVEAQPVNLDSISSLLNANSAPTFNAGNFVVTTPIGAGADKANTILYQPDGKIIVAGYSQNAVDGDFALVRYNKDGSLDASFSGDGKLVTAVGDRYDEAFSMALQPDGKIITVGTSIFTVNGYNKSHFALARYNTDGSLDTSFSGDGKLTHAVYSGNQAQSVVLQQDGKIIVAGIASAAGNQGVSLVRFNSDGSIDNSFAVNAASSTNKSTLLISGLREVHSVNILSNGKILVAGGTTANRTELIRFNSNGSPDTSFSGDGRVSVNLGFYSAVLPLSDGRLYVASASPGTSISGFGTTLLNISMINSDGSIPQAPYFSSKTIDVGLNISSVRSVEFQADGKILVSGNGYLNLKDFALVRYNMDGNLDTSFGNNGMVSTPIGSGDDTPTSITYQPDGKILVAGSSFNGTNEDFALARYNYDGTLDTGFNNTSSLNATVRFTENSAAVVLDNNVFILDADLNSLDNYSGSFLTLSRNGGANSEDLFSGAGIVAGQASGEVTISSTVVGGYTWSAGTLTITFNDSATQSLVNQTLRSLAYSNSSDAPPSSVQINWTFNDGNTGSQGAGGAQSVTGSSTVNITAINDAPVLTAASPALTTITEDATTNPGQTVASFLGTSLSDVDASAVEGVAIYGTAGSHGGWQYSTNSGSTWTSIGAVSSSSALLLRDTDYVRWLPDGTNGTTATLSYYGWDRTTGSVGSKVNVSTRGGTTAFSSDSDTATLTVTSVNDLPIVANAIPDAIATEGSAFSFTFANDRFTDVDTGNIFNYSAKVLGGEDLPSWLNFNPSTRTFSGTPSKTHVGSLDVTVTAVDSAGASVQDTFRITVNNLNDLPTGTVTIAGTPTQGETLTASNDLADDDGLGAISYQWLANGAVVSGASGSTLVLGQAQVGKTITVRASYTDAFGTLENKTSLATVVVANINDLPTGNVSISGMPIEGRVLTATNSLADADGLGGVVYTWQADGLTIGNGTNYTLTEAEAGKTVSVTATYTDLFGTLESVTSDTTDTIAKNDSPTGNVTISGTAAVGQTLSVVNTLADGDGLGEIIYTWQANGITIGNGGTYTITQVELGKSISVMASYTDDGGILESVTSASTSRVGTSYNLNGTLIIIPEMGEVSITLNNKMLTGAVDVYTAYKVRDVNVSTLSNATNYVAPSVIKGSLGSDRGDFGPIELVQSYRQTGATNSTVYIWKASFTPDNEYDGIGSITSDGFGYTYTKIYYSIVNSKTVSRSETTTLYGTSSNVSFDIDTSPPKVSITSNSDSLLIGESAQITFVLSQPSSDFTLDSITVSGGILSDFSGSGTNYSAFFKLSPNTNLPGLISVANGKFKDATGNINIDGNDTDNKIAITRGNSPLSGGVTISGTTAQNQSLVASNNLDDLDGLGAIAYQWLANAEPILGATGGVLHLSEAQVGKVISVRASYIDGSGFSESVTSEITSTVVNVNDVPVLANPIVDVSVNEDSGLSFTLASNAFSDVDVGDTFTYSATLSGGGEFPSWLSFNASTGTFSGTPVNANVGSLDVTVTAVDSAGASVQDTFSITVNNVNDAPVLTAAAPTLTTITENATTNSANPGQTVASFLGTSLSDVDASAVEGVAIYATAGSYGGWQYSTNSGSTWTSIGAVSSSSALLLRDTDYVRWLPDGTNGPNGTTSTFSYYGWDQTTGSVGSKVSVATRGGTTAFSSVSDTATLFDTTLSTPVISLENDSGVSATDRVTNDGRISITGIDPDATWQYSLDAGQSWNASTDPSYNFSNSTDGNKTFQVKVTDLAGNVRTSDNFSFILDRVSPLLTSMTPSNTSNNVAVSANFVFDFNENVYRAAKTIPLYWNTQQASGDGILVESFNVASTTKISIIDGRVTIDPSFNLNTDNLYTFNLPEGFVQDLAGNAATINVTNYSFQTRGTTAAVNPGLINGTFVVSAIIDQDSDGYGLYRTSSGAYVVDVANLAIGDNTEVPLTLKAGTKNYAPKVAPTALLVYSDNTYGLISGSGTSWTEQKFNSAGATVGGAVKLTPTQLLEKEKAFAEDIDRNGTVGDKIAVVYDIGAEDDHGLYKTSAGFFVIDVANLEVGDTTDSPLSLKTGAKDFTTKVDPKALLAYNDGSFGLISGAGIAWSELKFNSAGVSGATTKLNLSQLLEKERTFQEDINKDNVIGDKVTAVYDLGAEDGYGLYKTMSGDMIIDTAYIGINDVTDNPMTLKAGTKSYTSKTNPNALLAYDNGSFGVVAGSGASWTEQKFNSAGQSVGSAAKLNLAQMLEKETTFTEDINRDGFVGDKIATAVDSNGYISSGLINYGLYKSQLTASYFIDETDMTAGSSFTDAAMKIKTNATTAWTPGKSTIVGIAEKDSGYLEILTKSGTTFSAQKVNADTGLTLGAATKLTAAQVTAREYYYDMDLNANGTIQLVGLDTPPTGWDA